MDPQRDRELDDIFNAAATPIAPPPALKDSILRQIAETPQVAEAREEADVVSLGAARDKREPHTQWWVAAAAGVAIFAGVGGAALYWGGASETQTVTAAGVEEMHTVMDAPDARQGQTEAMGATLDIALSSSMSKGGAMVNGQPALADGMGAQVWAVMPDGAMMSAGVIGQEPHDDVWMPLPGDTTEVVVTEEVEAGAETPSGPVLARVSL
ncbi:anti-sigma factor [Corynebacterium sp. TA-R-1]|uniref:Anti-sigma factor n=1 Tax=Corynebacterium stercoris TaxID=2943490 RepID=A0ABT1G5A2_9CORY|nr:anti-sigma factor [Corynebacterium stercoris]MCP1387887.1 anti-sigma factor [Corynebacterium stercoris]